MALESRDWMDRQRQMVGRETPGGKFFIFTPIFNP
jgi:hypothetical protein